MIKIHYPTAFKALNNFIDDYNKHVVKRSNRIISSTTLAAKEIVRIYGVSLLKAKGVTDDMNMPSLRTNNQQLAKLVKCSPRSVQRHITRLLTAGIITRKVFHGTNASYEIWISPVVLFDNVKKDIEVNSNATLKKNEEIIIAGESSLIKTNCSDTYSTGYLNNIINTVHSVDNSERLPRDKGHVTGYSGTGHTGEKSWLGDKGLGGGDPLSPTQATTLNFYVSKLWMLARNLLYKDVYISSEQELIAKNHLAKFYENVSDSVLPRVHEIYVERIQLVVRYLKKDTNRYVQLPYRYFDVDNPGGFVGTKKWWRVYNTRKKEIQNKLILNAQVRKYNNNLRKSVTLQRPHLDVFRECEQRIGKLQDPSLLNQFHAIVLPPGIYNQLNQA